MSAVLPYNLTKFDLSSNNLLDLSEEQLDSLFTSLSKIPNLTDEF